MTSLTTNLYEENGVMEEFISCYRHFTALWDSSSKDYLCKKKKEPGYQELLKILQRVNHDASVHDVKRKINSLRCCYRREIKKIRLAYEGYEPRLWWFHLMDFLKPVLNIQTPPRSQDDEDDDGNGLYSCDEASLNDDDIFPDPFKAEEDALGLEPEPIVRLKDDQLKVEDTGSGGGSYHKPHNAKHRRRRRSSDDDRERKRRFMAPDQAENECDLMGKRMAAHFRNMRTDQRLFAERIISEVLVYGRMNRLTLEARFMPTPADEGGR